MDVSSIFPRSSVRLAGADEEHVRTLAELTGATPPIVVHHQSMCVIDGMHRLYAAMARGDSTVPVHFFDGSDEDAFVLSVRLNAEHGLPLTRAERRAAAERVVRSHPMLSDRAVSALCGVAASTVAGIRTSHGEASAATARLGRDGRVRPLRAAEAHTRARQLLAEKPDATVREIATAAGVSIGTAHSIRRSFSAAPVEGVPAGPAGPPRRQVAPAGPAPRTAVVIAAGPCPGPPSSPHGELEPLVTALNALRNDPAVRSSSGGRVVLRLLSAGVYVESEWKKIATVLPPYCSPLIVAAARSCALAWARFADHVESLEQDNG
ncbi:ParB/RepB/Spo0J family partition protein [Saccharothrix sp. BKS2]|uniref:ParB/RepB/Spo0J family partition protein n=1 Tax=Saccharothrix sp. BKS2 TaxID=3064400 RepID=UPI0039E98E35